jgi:hypothetical protein
MPKRKTVPQKLVLNIIRNRRNSSLVIGIGWLVLVAMFVVGLTHFKYPYWFKKDSIIFGLVTFFIIFVPLYLLNAIYYESLKSSYRIWNKLVYIYLVRLFIIFEVVWAVINFFRLFSTDKEDGFTRAGKGVQAALAASSAYLVYKNMNTAEIVDLYFKQTAR